MEPDPQDRPEHPSEHVSQPNADWEFFEDLLEDDMIPDFGIRIFTYVDTAGRRGYKWYGTGASSTVEDIVGLLERVKFLLQFRSEIEDMIYPVMQLMGMDPDDMNDDPESSDPEDA